MQSFVMLCRRREHGQLHGRKRSMQSAAGSGSLANDAGERWRPTSAHPPTPTCPPTPGFEDAEMELVRHVSFVDCPGHDILMATMLNGAAVMDGAMLLIAANEPCPQPQTSEHLAAVEIMRLQHIIILQVGWAPAASAPQAGTRGPLFTLPLGWRGCSCSVRQPASLPCALQTQLALVPITRLCIYSAQQAACPPLPPPPPLAEQG